MGEPRCVYLGCRDTITVWLYGLPGAAERPLYTRTIRWGRLGRPNHGLR